MQIIIAVAAVFFISCAFNIFRSMFGSRTDEPTPRFDNDPIFESEDEEPPEVYAKDQHRPEGKWVEATLREEVAGVPYHRKEATEWADCVWHAEREGRPYGIELVLEPDNPHDCNAIKVVGFVVAKSQRLSWHIGYVARQTARELHSDLVSKGLSIAAELESIFRIGKFVGVYFVVLAPPRNSYSVRMKRLVR